MNSSFLSASFECMSIKRLNYQRAVSWMLLPLSCIENRRRACEREGEKTEEESESLKKRSFVENLLYPTLNATAAAAVAALLCVCVCERQSDTLSHSLHQNVYRKYTLTQTLEDE